MSRGFRGHELKITGPDPNGKLVGRCSCGKWAGFNKDRDQLVKAWNKKHVNKFDDWK